MNKKTSTVIAKLEARLGRLVINTYSCLLQEDEVYESAAAKACKIVDQVLRPLVDESGQKDLDAFRFFHNRSFVPPSWKKGNRVKQELLNHPERCMLVYDWEGQAYRDEALKKWRGIIVLLTHYVNFYRPRNMVIWFFRETRGAHPELYAEVLGSLVKSLEKAYRKAEHGPYAWDYYWELEEIIYINDDLPSDPSHPISNDDYYWH